ncbi:MAG TPA: neutral zinc metallopeptidase [Aquabacterium sp.]|uniref:KPN_02809 family neutral zinc metallopeptidase n=1 Tax=Aquabacterium sp. TaxID=1872578 RepID=UPI002E355B1B|nr:neutral zinc metallopeptidase [Aquabacterium sp.]HEX5358031.1 neutral zinc metallopeptidase [Aquabacterium sp.]
MRWQGNRESDNVEDVRDGAGGGAGPGMSFGGRGIGLGSVAVALVASYFLGVNPLTVLNMLSGGGGMSAPSPAHQPAASRSHAPANDEQTRFVRTVLADTEDVWHELFKQAGGQYQDPRLVLFRGSVPTACGQGQSATGPFYCPGDQKVYIDLGFYDVLRDRLGAPGDFAQAYVIAHEVGHHVQNLLGTSAKVDEMRHRLSKTQYNALSVRLELQADCYAGVWANHAQQARQIIEAGDVEEAMNAAAQIGDDTLQRNASGHVSPESFTHGTSQQRMTWFKRGMESGDMRQCNTFAKDAV